MAEAAVAGRAVSLDDAVAEAAALLGRGRVAIGGLGADVAGVEAAIRLARRLGATVDHAHAAPALRDLSVMRQAGWIVTTPLQARARADVVVLVGDDLDADWPGLEARLLLGQPPPLFPDAPRAVLRLGGADVLGPLAVLRAHLAGRAVAVPPPLAEAAARLREARYAVVVWSAARLDVLAIEMLCGLIDDLNATTRCAGLPLAPPGNAAGAMQAAAWLTGLPLPLGFDGPGGVARHDPWRHDAGRRIGDGQADAGLWISAIEATAPAWSDAVPTVALTAAGTAFARPPAVAITVGRPGVDHDSVLFEPDLGALGARPASAPSAAPAAAAILARIAAALPC